MSDCQHPMPHHPLRTIIVSLKATKRYIKACLGCGHVLESDTPEGPWTCTVCAGR